MSEWKETELGLAPIDWLELTVNELVEMDIIYKPLDGNHGNIHPKGSDFVKSGIPFIMASDIKNGKVDILNCSFISQEQANALQKGFSITNDVLLTHKASLGRTAIVGNLKIPYIMLTPQVTYYRVKDYTKLSNVYLKYFFDSPAFQGVLENHGNSGSTRAYVGITAQRELPILLPDIEIQYAIASVLSSLDDKIDLLHRQNATLEKMAETLFKQWFVEEAKEEWEMGCIADICTHHKASVQPQKNPTKEYYHYSIPAFDNNKNLNVELGGAIQSNKYLVPQYCILFSKLNPHKDKRVWLLQNEVEDNSICSTEFQVVLPKKRTHLYFIHGWLSYSANYNEIASGVGGTSGSHQRIDPSIIFNFQCPIIDDIYIEKYNGTAEPLYQKTLINQAQICTLTQLRDTLLPKLMSGEVRVEI